MLREDRRLKVLTEKKRRGHSDEEGGHKGKNTELPPSKSNTTDVLKRSNSCSTSASAILGRKGNTPHDIQNRWHRLVCHRAVFLGMGSLDHLHVNQPGTCLKTYVPGPHSRVPEAGSLGMGPSNLHF